MLEKGVLPRQMPEHMIVIPTMDRWERSLPDLLKSVGALIGDASDNTAIVIADGTKQHSASQVGARETVLSNLPSALQRNTFVLSVETQKKIADVVAESTGIERAVVDAYLTWTGYGSQRGKLDMVARGYAVTSPKKILSLDDDTTIPTVGKIVDPAECAPELRSRANSQIILRKPPPDSAFTAVKNSLKGFFEPLGKPADLNRLGTEALHDTMHDALEQAQVSGAAAQFVVTATPGVEQPVQGTVVATVASKSGVPDYRTIKIAQANLRDGFPDEEVAFSSYPSGPSQEFAFRTASTNVDSACIGRLFDAKTSQLGWWLITDEQISKANSLKTVTTHYRADNENLPRLLERVHNLTGDDLWYVGGISTHVLHHRARSGYRPDIIEQSTASLVGNLVAQAALDLMQIDPITYCTTLKPIPKDYKVPTDQVERVFKSLVQLAEDARAGLRRIDSIDAGVGSPEIGRSVAQQRQRYERAYEALYAKTGGFDAKKFEECVNQEIGAQLDFYRRVLQAAPRIEAVIVDLIGAEKYEVLVVK